jgi:hypothetical protein
MSSKVVSNLVLRRGWRQQRASRGAAMREAAIKPSLGHSGVALKVAPQALQVPLSRRETAEVRKTVMVPAPFMARRDAGAHLHRTRANRAPG